MQLLLASALAVLLAALAQDPTPDSPGTWILQIEGNATSLKVTGATKKPFEYRTPREAYLVKCDSETTTQNDINLGIVNILVGFAPLKPAEFVIIKIQQLAGQIAA